jgi:hypothetical protein
VNGDTFTFSNEHLTIAVETNFPNFPQEPLTVESVTFTTPQDTFTLSIDDFVVPPPVVEHVLDHLGLGFDLPF